MSELDQEKDFNLPPCFATLSDWRWFAGRNLGMDSAAYAYLERLCQEHGPDYEIELEPSAFLLHIGMVAHTNAHEAWVRGRAA